MDPPETFAKGERYFRKRSGQFGMSTLLRKSSEILALSLSENGQKILWRKLTQYPAQLNVFHQLMQKVQHLEAHCEDRTQKHTICSLKRQKIFLLVAVIYRREQKELEKSCCTSKQYLGQNTT